jgi:polyribonucleotide nucleotidyltransferase
MIVISTLNIIDIGSIKFIEFNNNLHKYASSYEDTLIVTNKKIHTIIGRKNDIIVKIRKHVGSSIAINSDVKWPEWIRKYPYIKIVGNMIIFKTTNYNE